MMIAAGKWREHYTANSVDKKWRKRLHTWIATERWLEDLPLAYEDPKEAAIAKAKERGGAREPGSSSGVRKLPRGRHENCEIVDAQLEKTGDGDMLKFRFRSLDGQRSGQVFDHSVRYVTDMGIDEAGARFFSGIMRVTGVREADTRKLIGRRLGVEVARNGTTVFETPESAAHNRRLDMEGETEKKEEVAPSAVEPVGPPAHEEAEEPAMAEAREGAAARLAIAEAKSRAAASMAIAESGERDAARKVDSRSIARGLPDGRHESCEIIDAWVEEVDAAGGNATVAFRLSCVGGRHRGKVLDHKFGVGGTNRRLFSDICRVTSLNQAHDASDFIGRRLGVEVGRDGISVFATAEGAAHNRLLNQERETATTPAPEESAPA
jgi:hypothetical protein